MRTSNKILLSTFIVTILIITAIHVVLSAKIKNGEIVTFHDANGSRERFALGNIKHVSIKGLEECRIVPGDSAILEIRRDYAASIKYRVTGDSLIIHAGIPEAEYEQGSRRHVPFTLYLPPVESITTKYSHVFLRGGQDSATAISRTINIHTTRLDVSATTRELKPAYWNNLQVNAQNSQAVFTQGAIINDLTVNLNAQSSMTDAGADLRHFSLQVDSTSTVSLRKNSLNNIKLVK